LIDSNIFLTVVIFGIVNLLAIGIAWGRISVRVENLEKLLRNGFTCKSHADTMEKIGRLEK
jgi:hypothetical protein